MTPPKFRSSRRKPGPSSLGDGCRGETGYPSGSSVVAKALGPGFRRDERKERTLALVLALWLTVTPALAQEPAAAPDRPLPSAAQEARAQALFDELRCVVCQHESIADSPAGIAGDMRGLVREQIAAGSTDAEVKADMVRRYGDYVLFRPPVRGGTWLLWFGPLALVVVGGGALWAMASRRPVEAAALTPDEEARLDEVLRNDRFGPDHAASSPHDGRSVKATETGADVGTQLGSGPHRPISDG